MQPRDKPQREDREREVHHSIHGGVETTLLISVIMTTHSSSAVVFWDVIKIIIPRTLRWASSYQGQVAEQLGSTFLAINHESENNGQT